MIIAKSMIQMGPYEANQNIFFAENALIQQ